MFPPQFRVVDLPRGRAGAQYLSLQRLSRRLGVYFRMLVASVVAIRHGQGIPDPQIATTLSAPNGKGSHLNVVAPHASRRAAALTTFLRPVEEFSQEAHECDKLQRSLRIILDKFVRTRIPQACYGTREHHHEALLFIAVALVGKIVEVQEKTRSISCVPSSASPLRIRTKSFRAFTASSIEFA